MDIARDLLIQATKSSLDPELTVCFEPFLSLSRDDQLALLNSIYVIDSSPTIADLEEVLLTELNWATRPQNLPLLLERLEGWWVKRVIKQLIGTETSAIPYEDLEKEVFDLQSQFGESSLPIDFLDLEVPDNESQLAERERIFVEQLKLLNLEKNHIAIAIGDYYRAYSQRSRWLREHLLLGRDWDKYENRLVDEWKRQSIMITEEIEDPSDETEKETKGKELLKWMEKDAPSHPYLWIRPNTSEPYVVRGSYHMLSNDLRVGWHHDFKSRLQHLLLRVGAKKKK